MLNDKNLFMLSQNQKHLSIKTLQHPKNLKRNMHGYLQTNCYMSNDFILNVQRKICGVDVYTMFRLCQ